MEFVQDVDKQGNVLSRVAIPNAVVAASDNRDLVGQYADANAAQREAIHKAAIEKTSPPKQEKAEAAPEEVPVAGAESE